MSATDNMIPSILDTDLYKLTQQQAIISKYPKAEVEYTFINRGTHTFTADIVNEIREQIYAMSNLSLTKQGYDFLRSCCPYLNATYLDFLRGYRFQPNEISTSLNSKNQLCLSITGPWYRTVLWEVPIMSIISESYFNYADNRSKEVVVSLAKKRTEKKRKEFEVMKILLSEFGTRRRHSYNVQKTVIEALRGSDCCVGTSNVHFAMLNDMIPKGTQAHEFIQFHAAKFGYKMANLTSMKAWTDVYQGELGIVLPDTFTTDVFLRSFNSFYAKLFDGVRQDSGNPIEFTSKVIRHYNKLGIDPTTKTIIYSDGISSIEKIKEIVNCGQGSIRQAFGIGTWLTNDVDIKPLNMVIKMTGAKPFGMDWTSTCKLSDSVGKHTGKVEEVELCKKILKI